MILFCPRGRDGLSTGPQNAGEVPNELSERGEGGLPGASPPSALRATSPRGLGACGQSFAPAGGRKECAEDGGEGAQGGVVAIPNRAFRHDASSPCRAMKTNSEELRR